MSRVPVSVVRGDGFSLGQPVAQGSIAGETRVALSVRDECIRVGGFSICGELLVPFQRAALD